MYRVANDLFYEVISVVFDKVYKKVDTIELLGYASKFNAITLRIDMFTSLFHTMKRSNDVVHTNETIELVLI